MLVEAPIARLITAGKKTQIRRLVPARVPKSATSEDASAYSSYSAGRSYQLERAMREHEMTEEEKARAAKPKGRPPRITVGRVNVTDVRLQRLGDVTLPEARAEGFRNLDDFRVHWLRLHDRAWAGQHLPVDQEPDAKLVADRFQEKWSRRRVWAIDFEVDRAHAPQLLAARPGRDYVDSEFDPKGRRIAMAGEPEALSPHEYETHVDTEHQRVKEATRKTDVRDQQRKDRELLSFEQRLVAARDAARRNGIDVSGEFTLLRRCRAKADGPGEVRMLQAIERFAYREAA